MHVRSWRRVGALLAGAALLPVLAASPAAAAGIVVNSKSMLTQDDGTCTLPEAIKAANTDTASGASTGECAAGAGTADTITFGVSGTIYTTRLPDITQGLILNGGNKITLNGQGASSFFIANASSIYLVNITFTNGRSQYGGAVFVGPAGVVYLEHARVTNNRAQQGGGVIVAAGADLTVVDSTISGNTGTQTGGGIHLGQGAFVQLVRSTVSGNSSPYGAGVFASSTAVLAVDNSTIAKNVAGNTGGALYAAQNVGLTLVNSTVSLNSASTSLGGLYADTTANVNIQNSIIAGNTKGNAAGAAIDTSVSNIIGGSTTGLLDPAGLQANGGPTKTIKLLATAAAALDDGNTGACTSVGNVDQRGLTRGSPCDIGAVERDRDMPTTTAPQAQLRSGTTLTGTSSRAVLRWTGVDGVGGSGIARYQLQQRINSGPYTTISSSITGPARTITLANGNNYQFRVRAIDRDGNTGPYATAAVIKPRLVQNNSSSIAYAGTWKTVTSSSYSGGSVRYATQTNDETATYSFTGSSVAFITTTAKTRGIVRVYIDGQIVGLLDQYSSSTVFRKALYARSWPTSGVHSIRIENWGGSGRTRVDIDAFAVIK